MISQKIDKCLADRSTRSHSIYGHTACAISRIALGTLLVLRGSQMQKKSKLGCAVLLIVVLLLFVVKYLSVLATDTLVWKVYLRMILAYSASLILLINEKIEHAGLVIIADALMGIQSRQVTYNLLSTQEDVSCA